MGNKAVLEQVMNTSIEEIGLSRFLSDSIKMIGIKSVKDIVTKDEEYLTRAVGIGDARARKIFKIAYNTIVEYIAGQLDGEDSIRKRKGLQETSDFS